MLYSSIAFPDSAFKKKKKESPTKKESSANFEMFILLTLVVFGIGSGTIVITSILMMVFFTFCICITDGNRYMTAIILILLSMYVAMLIVADNEHAREYRALNKIYGRNYLSIFWTLYYMGLNAKGAYMCYKP